MKRSICFSALSAVFFPSLGASLVPAAGEETFLRADYYVWNRFERQGGPDADQIRDIEVLIFFSPLVPDAKGKLSIDRKFEEALTRLKKVKSPKTRLWLGLGDLRAVSQNGTATEALSCEVVRICGKYGFSGVDIDWEGNADVSPPVYAGVVKVLSDQCRKAGLAMACSVGTGPHYIAKAGAAQKYLDYVNVQFYWSRINAMPLNEFKDVLSRFEKAGVPRRKLLAGLPIYGMADMGRNKNAQPTAIGYKSMIEKGADPKANQWLNPDNGVTYFYSGQPLLLEKLRYARKNGYGGVFTWELTMDADYHSSQSLLRVIDKACKESGISFS